MTKKLTLLTQYFYQCNYLKSILKKYSDCMQPGKYKLLPSMRAIALNKPYVLNIAKFYFPKKAYTKKTIYLSHLLNIIFNYKNNKKNINGNNYVAIYIANNHDKLREVKLFSFDQKKILTVCTTKKSYKNQILQYEKLKRFYNIPELKESKYENAFEVSMVELEPRPPEIEAIKCIVNSTIKANNLNGFNKVCLNNSAEFTYQNIHINFLMNKIISNIDTQILKCEFPLCMQHGDLSQDNLIYGKSNSKKDYWWIDWEHAKERIFFYDLFFYMLNSAVYSSNSEAIESYLNGEFDNIVEMLFQNFGLTYNKMNRKDYFLVFVVLFFKERVCKLGKISVLNMYIDYLTKYKLLR